MLIRNILILLLMIILLFTLTNCCTTKNDLKDEGMKNISHNAELSPSPGNAQINCSVQDLFSKGNKSYCKIKVSSVLKYGSGTRPIGSGSILELEYNDDMNNDLQSIISKNDDVKLLIAEVPSGMGMENSSSYRIIKIIK